MVLFYSMSVLLIILSYIIYIKDLKLKLKHTVVICWDSTIHAVPKFIECVQYLQEYVVILSCIQRVCQLRLVKHTTRYTRISRTNFTFNLNSFKPHSIHNKTLASGCALTGSCKGLISVPALGQLKRLFSSLKLLAWYIKTKIIWIKFTPL